MSDRKQKLKGTVVSTKMQKTIVVEVLRYKKHPRYKKYIRVSKRYKAHSENPEIREGDHVVIMSGRPLSRGKKWVVEERHT